MMRSNRILRCEEPIGGLGQRLTKIPVRILVVDEDSDLRLRYAFVLGRPGYEVNGAEDGAAGWDALEKGHYNLLITENELPCLTGLELVKKLRAARMTLPVVMASGRLPADELAQDPSIRLAATLAKPFAVEALLDTVKNVLRRPGLMSTNSEQKQPCDHHEVFAGQNAKLQP